MLISDSFLVPLSSHPGAMHDSRASDTRQLVLYTSGQRYGAVANEGAKYEYFLIPALISPLSSWSQQ